MQRRYESFPRLYGAPAQFRGANAGQSERPLTADDLPLEFERALDEQDHADMLLPRPYRYGARAPLAIEEADTGELQPSHVSLRGLADELVRDHGSRAIAQFMKPGLGTRRTAM